MAGEVKATRRRSWRRRLGFALLAFALGIALLALLLEVGTRLFWELPAQMADFHNTGMYREVDGGFDLAPGYAGELRIKLLDVPVRSTTIAIDADGFRENGTPRPAGAAMRVLCAGDSLVFGYGVENGETWPAVLQRELTERRGEPVLVANAGVPAYGTVATAACIARRVPTFGPDAVVFGIFLGNDVTDDVSPEVTIVGGLQFAGGALADLMRTSWRARLTTRSRFWLWFETWLFTNYPQHSPLAAAIARGNPAARLPGFPRVPSQPHILRTDKGVFLDVRDEQHRFAPDGPPVVAEALATIRASLQRAKAACGDRRLLVLVQPTLVHVREDLWRAELERLQFDPAQFEFGSMRRRIRALAESLDLPCLDVHEVFAGEPDPQGLFIEDQGHFSARGNALVGKAVAERL